MERPAQADYPRGARMPPRVIDDHELVWMLAGQATFASDGLDHVLVPGELLLIPPGVRHSILWDQRRSCRHGYVHFRADRLGAGAPRAEEVRAEPMTREDPLAGICDYLLWLGRDAPTGWERRVRQTLRLVLELLAEGPLPIGDDEPTVAPALGRALEHLHREWAQLPLRRIDVGELAAAAAVSPSYLNRLFRASFGLSVAQGLEALRFLRAEPLVTHTDLTLDTVARQCGWADQYHFSHRFRTRYGIPPGAHRRGRGAGSVLDDAGVRRLAAAVSAHAAGQQPRR